MFILTLAWKNLWRNRMRSLITIAAIFFAVLLSVLMSSLKTGIFENLIKNVVGFYTGYIQIHQTGYWNDQLLDNAFELNPVLEKKIHTNKHIANYAPRLESFALASSSETTKGCMVIGIDPEVENKITALASRMIQGKYINADEPGILIAEGLLKRIKLGLNDTLVFIGQGFHGSMAAGKYPIKGVVQFGSPDLNDKVIYMPIRFAQEMYGAEGHATSFVVALNNINNLTQTANMLSKDLGKDYEVMTWEQMLPDIKQHIGADTQNMLFVQAILYLLISFGIFGTLLMMMAERKFELGMLLAIGMKKTKLAFLLLTESILTVFIGCILGILTSIPLVYYFYKRPIRITGEAAKAYEQFGFEAIFPTSLHYTNFVSQGVIILIIGLLLSLYPVFVVYKLDPVNAMKK